MKLNPFKRDKDPFAHDMSGLFRGAYQPKRKKPWLFRHRWIALALATIVVFGAMAGFAVWRFYNFQGNIQKEIEGVEQAKELEPFNVLLVGSDSREGLTEEEQLELGAAAVAGQRADTLILAHIDPETSHVTMVQFPRDLYVPVDGGGETKINEALQGGRAALVRTMSDLTGLPINNYAQVNIAGFRDVVDAIGGVNLCITEPIPFDKQTGIEVTEEEIEESPLIHFDGERALRFVRSRAFPTGDFERIRNQQRFLAAAIDKVTSVGTFLSPTRITRLLKAAEENMVIDKNTSVGELLDIARKFRNFNPENYEAYTVPNFGIGNNEAGSVVLPDYDTMQVMFDAIKANESPLDADGVVPADIDMPAIAIGVYNGTFTEGVAAEAKEQIETATQTSRGTITVTEIANADRVNYKKSFIVFDPKTEGSKEAAEVLSRAIPNADLMEGRIDSDHLAEVIVGKEGIETVKLVQIVPIDIPEPGEVPRECR